jgi:hypothetical protein
MTNPVASQQPAPIPEDLKADYRDALNWYHGNHTRQLIGRVARLEAALTEVQAYAVHGCGTKQKDVRGLQFGKIVDICLGALATPLGTPGSTKEDANGNGR